MTPERKRAIAKFLEEERPTLTRFVRSLIGDAPDREAEDVLQDVAVGGIFLAASMALIFGWFVMLLWNWLIPGLFRLPVIGYWQAFGIIILGRLMVGLLSPSYYGHSREWDRAWNKFGRWSNWAPKGDPRNWRHYEQYWQDEGKKAFEDWLDRQKK
jgi:hypothetical protein